jgi:hypothetical protein
MFHTRVKKGIPTWKIIVNDKNNGNSRREYKSKIVLKTTPTVNIHASQINYLGANHYMNHPNLYE